MVGTAAVTNKVLCCCIAAKLQQLQDEPVHTRLLAQLTATPDTTLKGGHAHFEKTMKNVLIESMEDPLNLPWWSSLASAGQPNNQNTFPLEHPWTLVVNGLPSSLRPVHPVDDEEAVDPLIVEFNPVESTLSKTLCAVYVHSYINCHCRCIHHHSLSLATLGVTHQQECTCGAVLAKQARSPENVCVMGA